ncbi:DUF3005 domain-containing protein [Pararobbsia silviterrae]|uniref:DUF3005 domain-containing protein n=1 Tax=Pararobbsia silviterrae TaxID=1792498 RepID=A0A494Y892_9BURK|nr:DUF3005 domain-containing protein [Pararobbsia silviterrae]RKP57797.1 DUF3005 domain-containing protein [Pararobbsia silviterrae]
MDNDHEQSRDKRDQGKANPTQSQQNAISAQSPAKEPAHETAHADPGKMEKSFANASPEGHHPDTKQDETRRVARNATPLPNVDVSHKAIDHPDPYMAARSRIISHDTAGTEATDGTVDTDGKGREAQRERKPRQDHFIHSNATPDEHVPTSPFGLGGIDSRFEGPGVHIATQPGWRVVDLGTSVRDEFNGPRTSHRIRLEHTSQPSLGNPGASTEATPDSERDADVVEERKGERSEEAAHH